MADLSAVLRKTIDGLPRATPSMRAKVYEKARAAIARQIETANPPLADEVVAARRGALEGAIAQTESHYAALDLGEEQPPAPPPSPVPAPVAAAPQRAEPPLMSASRDDAPRVEPPPPPRATPRPPERARIEPSLGMPAPSRAAPGNGPLRDDRLPPPVVPVGIEPRDLPDPVEAPFPTGGAGMRDRRGTSHLEPPRLDSIEPETGLDEGAIPAADLKAPRQPNGARRAKTNAGSGRSPVLVGLGVLLFAGAATAAYVYLDDIRSALNISGSSTVASTPAETETAAATPSTDSEEEGTQASTAPAETAAATATAKRRFTQRLLPNGTEVDEGPAPTVANAFDEGTNVAAASPPTAETQPSAMSSAAGAPGADVPAAAGAPATTAPAETAAVQQTPPASATAPAVAQKAVFYEERSETEAGTQRAGNVVWSVVNEPPADGQPAEPAIRAVADVPEENIRLTLTIRRNTDATLPASHVIELMFDTPPNFPGGSIANVQRLALKPTEQARGEPLIGVAGKISDGFFIIALNNLSEAANANLDLLSKEQWIDIPIAYATGRRALMSIEKGIPGDRVFKQAIDAWAGKT